MQDSPEQQPAHLGGCYRTTPRDIGIAPTLSVSFYPRGYDMHYQIGNSIYSPDEIAVRSFY